jgi:anti-sigma regulatory factor (Ser/Thr protein kinase)
VNEFASSFLDCRGVAQKSIDVTSLVLEEVLSNIIRHGYDDTTRHEISVYLRVVEERVELEVVDDGRDFDPLTVRPVDIHESLEQRKVGGLGVHLLRTLASEVRHLRTAGRNHLHVRI